MELKSNKNLFDDFILSLEHKWLKIILILGITLVPLFGLLDLIIMPQEKLRLFLSLRFLVSGILILQLLLVLKFEWKRTIKLHAYFFTFLVGILISFMTTHLGGFESSYYAGLNLVLIAVNFFLPWGALYIGYSGLIVIAGYVGLNLVTDTNWEMKSLINNMFFMCATVIIAATIGHHKFKLIRSEFESRMALWSEMELAKKIQTVLLPENTIMNGYEIIANMLPATEVGGDYYEFIDSKKDGISWVLIGDVSGHGVSAGLVMMMAQTAISSFIDKEPTIEPSVLLTYLNNILKKNISRLGDDRYLTLTALRLEKSSVVFSGKHQDILIFRKKTGIVERIKTRGFWIGLIENLEKVLYNDTFEVEEGDVVLLYTDGIVELANSQGEMYDMDRLINIFQAACQTSIELKECFGKIMKNILAFSDKQEDDITMVLIKKHLA
ncbi:MAG: serine/threonine-protein phosphatase [Leptospiraceae bacterium]|nr:serine/threonine-protein phosphatase [Leptospiraceae bacterium]MCP5493778.1 serine/threonine-protein phosphatase [Leptospiraceae bacterium]